MKGPGGERGALLSSGEYDEKRRVHRGEDGKVWYLPRKHGQSGEDAMSAEATSAVWERSGAHGNARLILLCLANEAPSTGEDAGLAKLSVPRIAHACRISESTVQRCVRDLEKTGELVCARRGAEGRCTHYRFTFWTPEESIKARQEGGRLRRGHVYAVQRRVDGLVKVGFTADVNARLEQLGKGYPDGELVLLGTRPNSTQRTERAFHERLEHLSQGREWFTPESELFSVLQTGGVILTGVSDSLPPYPPLSEEGEAQGCLLGFNGTSPSVGSPSSARLRIGGKPVDGPCWALTEKVLAEFNAQSGHDYGALTRRGQPSEAAKRIYGRVIQWPDITLDSGGPRGDGYRGTIGRTLASRWWGADEPGVGVVFGPRVFEDNLRRDGQLSMGNGSLAAANAVERTARTLEAVANGSA